MKTLLTLLITISATFLLCSQDLYFPPLNSTAWETSTLDELGWCSDQLPTLQQFMVDSESKSLMVLKDGRIVIEEYYDGHAVDSFWYWASAAKTLTALEIGIHQENGLLDIGDKTSDYLGQGWTSCSTEDEDKITLWHQLTMTSGLDYTNDIDCTAPECLTCLNTPGEEWYYHNAPYTLLGDVIQEVSGTDRSVSTFLSVGSKIGMSGLWIQFGEARTFASTTRDMARFGLLMLARGMWGNTPVLSDMDYYNSLITPSQDINESYGYLWWLNTGPSFRLPSTLLTFQGQLIPDASPDIYMALGKNGQMVLVDPTENVVVIRMGNNPENVLVPATYASEIYERLAAVMCTSTSTQAIGESYITVSPNPAADLLHIESSNPINSISIWTVTGDKIIEQDQSSIDISQLPLGTYIVMVTSTSGTVSETFVKY